MTSSLAFHVFSMKGPEPALFVFSHPYPRSPSCSCESTIFLSTTEPIPAESAFRTSPGENSSVMVILALSPSTTTRLSTLSAVQPNWVTMNEGVFLSLTTRRSENTTSSAVTGFPEWNVIPGRMVNVMTLPPSLTSQLSATPPTSVVRSSGSYIIRRS